LAQLFRNVWTSFLSWSVGVSESPISSTTKLRPVLARL
jgi:hypothetical protein